MKNFFIKIIIILLFILIFLKQDIMYITIYQTTLIWFKNIVPNLLPIFIITSLIVDSNLILFLCKVFGKPFSKLFNTSIYGIFVFLLSLFSGTPSNAKYIKDLFDNNLISIEESNKLLLFTTNYNPLLIYSLLNLYLNKYNSLKIIFIINLTNIIIGLIIRKQKIRILPIKKIPKNIDLSKTIKNTIDTLLMILGTLICFNILINILPIKNHFIKNLLNGILEITTALKSLKLLNVSIKLKEILSLLYLSFGGISIHMQIKSILPDTNYKLFFKYKFISIFISFSIWAILC